MRIEIRDAGPEDAAAIQAICAPVVTGTATPRGAAAERRGDTGARRHAPADLPYLVAERDGRLVG